MIKSVQKIIFVLLFTAVSCFAQSSQEIRDSVFSAMELNEDFELPQKCLPTKSDKAFVKSILESRGELFGYIEDTFEEAGVPRVFAYIAIAESKLRDIRCKGNCVGVWQMKPQASRIHGLKVGKGLDERRDAKKATVAMAKYFSYLHKKFGSWHLAAIGFNCGEGRLAKAIKKAGTDDIATLLDPKKRYLSKTARVVFYRVLTLSLAGEELRAEKELLKEESAS